MDDDVLRSDNLINTLSGLGDPKVDKGMSWWITPGRKLRAVELESLYGDGDTLAARLVDLPVDESTRRGWRVVVDRSAEHEPEPFADYLDDLGVLEAIADADRWASLYGGAAIVLSIDDGRAAHEPVDEANIRAVRGLRVVDRHELTRHTFYTAADGVTPDRVGMPKLYYLVPHNGRSGSLILDGRGRQMGSSAITVIHESRVIPFVGFQVPPRQIEHYDGWGQPVLERFITKLQSVASAERAMGHIIHEWRIAVMAIKGLRNIVTGPESSKRLGERMTAFNLAKSIAKVAIIDAEGETFSQQGAPVTGLADVYYALCQSLSAITGIPVTLLYGEAPQGLSTDNKSGRTSWYDQVAARQRRRYRRPIRRICRLLQLAEDGPDVDDNAAFTVDFLPLQEPTDKEIADTRLVQAQVDEKYWDMGVLDAREVRESRFGGAGYSPDTRLMTPEQLAGGAGGDELGGDAGPA